MSELEDIEKRLTDLDLEIETKYRAANTEIEALRKTRKGLSAERDALLTASSVDTFYTMPDGGVYRTVKVQDGVKVFRHTNSSGNLELARGDGLYFNSPKIAELIPITRAEAREMVKERLQKRMENALKEWDE